MNVKSVCLIVALVLSGCTSKENIIASSSTGEGTPQSTANTPSFAQFSDIPIPSKATMDVDRTLLFGGTGNWYGRLVMSSGHKPQAVFDFYKQEMTAFGWQELTSIRSAQSIMSYARSDRVATIQIEKASLGGSEVMITVSPRGATAATGQNPL